MILCPPFSTVSLSDVGCTADFARETSRGDEEEDGDVVEEVKFGEIEGGGQKGNSGGGGDGGSGNKDDDEE